MLLLLLNKLGPLGNIRWSSRMATTAAAAAVTATDSERAHVHYNHTDSCSALRWNSRESFQYMYAKPWDKVSEFYSKSVRDGRGGHGSLSSLFAQKPVNGKHDFEDAKSMVSAKGRKDGRWERITYKILVSYNGGSFDGWQRQPGLNTVQELIEKALGSFVDDRKAQKLRENSLPVEGCVVVAGRTDKGVTALQQVCSFYTWRKDVKTDDIKDAVNNAATGGILTALFVSEVSRAFHPNFSAKWRRYCYIFPLEDSEQTQTSETQKDCAVSSDVNDDEINMQIEHEEDESTNGDEGFGTVMKPRSFSVSKVNQLLLQLEGRFLSYKMFARDTKASRNNGPATECFMFHARAAEANLPNATQDGSMKVMCVELVANRFLRKMVRVLVATAIREAAAGAEDDALLKLMDATCRRATAPPAPPDGLCLVDVGYSEFDPNNCLIL